MIVTALTICNMNKLCLCGKEKKIVRTRTVTTQLKQAARSKERSNKGTVDRLKLAKRYLKQLFRGNLYVQLRNSLFFIEGVVLTGCHHSESESVFFLFLLILITIPYSLP